MDTENIHIINSTQTMFMVIITKYLQPASAAFAPVAVLAFAVTPFASLLGGGVPVPSGADEVWAPSKKFNHCLIHTLKNIDVHRVKSNTLNWV
jgi:hypothetical protein